MASLEQAWQEALAAGHVADAYLALLLHPCLDEDLARRAYEAVHVHTHAATTELRRLRAELSQQRAESAARRAELEEARAALARHAASASARQRETSAADATAAALAAARRRVTELGQALAELRVTHSRDLRRAEHEALRRAERAEHEARAWKRLCLRARTRAETAAPAGPGPGAEPRPMAATPATTVDLGGLELAYIGGRTRLAPRLRAVAERYNARLACHDGGLQEHATILDAVIARSSVVLCPLDRVSHDAAMRLKRHCKRHDKPMVWLRSSSLSTFARQLRLLASRRERRS